MGNDGGPGSQVLPWRTLTHALASVHAGDTVRAVAGSYGAGESFPLTLVNGVALVGAGADVTEIAAPAGRNLFEVGDQPLGPDTRLEGFTLELGEGVSATALLFRFGSAVVAPTIVGNAFDAYSGTAIQGLSEGAVGGVFAPRIVGNQVCGFLEMSLRLHEGGSQLVAPVVEDNTFECGDAGSFEVSAGTDWTGTIAPVLRRNAFAGNVFFRVVPRGSDRRVEVFPHLEANAGSLTFNLCPPPPGAGSSLVTNIEMTGDDRGHSSVRVQCSSPDGPGVGSTSRLWHLDARS